VPNNTAANKYIKERPRTVQVEQGANHGFGCIIRAKKPERSKVTKTFLVSKYASEKLLRAWFAVIIGAIITVLYIHIRISDV